MNVALEFGKQKNCCTIIFDKVKAWTNCWAIDNGCGIAPKNFIEFLLKDYGF
jgi:hypothetical protein